CTRMDLYYEDDYGYYKIDYW
nr:immunoglobulin heavy chain junction region [Macaca mulatta]MOX91725.1 immunoglobulin heavy chain junction region [Macaca mulatta]MOX94853.1 immunoglobulin heavy chain junction region [Macaca mulatta]MOX96188.1 immunoglobulin heavy chain junction region [Macaca mulatta]MOX97044.1 immunoglobulin heavy chain junction region [Macaca mulatta]